MANPPEQLPNSSHEKQISYVVGAPVEHWMFVHELKALLDQLAPTDWLTPTDTHNLLIRRDDGSRGIVDFAFNQIEWFTKPEEPDGLDH